MMYLERGFAAYADTPVVSAAAAAIARIFFIFIAPSKKILSLTDMDFQKKFPE